MIVDFNGKSFLLIVKILIFLLKTNTSEYVRNTPRSLVSVAYGNNALHLYTTTTNEIPYHVLIAYHNLYCSGTLIRSKVVVTAASCFVKWQGHRIVVKVGSDTVTGIGQVIEAVEVKKHEYFGHSSLMDNDIAILMLKDHVAFDFNVQKIIMIEPDMSLPPGSVVDVSGYADDQSAKYANRLLWSDMTLLNNGECIKLYPGLMTRSNYCAKYSAERHLKDNGGPAVFKDMLVGILSYGAANDKEPFVAVLTNVSYFHKFVEHFTSPIYFNVSIQYRWISLNVKRFMLKYCVKSEQLADAYYQETEEY